MWSADGRSVFYVSDRSGAQNIWTSSVGAGATPKQVSTFKSGRVLWPSISSDGRLIAFLMLPNLMLVELVAEPR